MSKKPDNLVVGITLDIAPGRYVVAVSGGVDSMALLDMLRQLPNVSLVVAHFDHGVRPDSGLDRQLVQQQAQKYSLAFEYQTAALGPGVSEDVARRARYDFLRATRHKYEARAIITAHHQDDLLETAFINLARGTGRRGLTSLQSGPDIVRPLLHLPKSQLVGYARHHHLQWREDSTNADQTYLRNKIRHTVMPRLTKHQRQRLLQTIHRQTELNRQIDAQIDHWLRQHAAVGANSITLPRYQLVMLPAAVAHQIIQEISRRLTGTTVLAPQAWAALHFAKTAHPGRTHHVAKELMLASQPNGQISVTSG